MPRSKPSRKKRTRGPSIAGMMLGGPEGDDPLARAQEIAYDAWEAETPRQRVALARRALSVSPLCADAYVLLAQQARSALEREELLQRGVEAGEKALGPATFQNDVGYFWGLLETRPYMRARFGFAEALWERGRHDDALGHFRELLRLNPDDNQGVRYVLAAYLTELGRDKELGRLLQEYEEECSAAWAYTTALLAFRRSGDCAASKKALADAFTENPHVPGYLLGRREKPKASPAMYSPGDPSEAVYYVNEFGRGWLLTPGALEWLGKQTPQR